MKITLASIASLLVFANVFGVEATQSHRVPPISYEFVGLGDACSPTRQCRSPYACGTIPGRDGQFCVAIVGPDATCTQEYYQCTTGYKCVIPSGQYQGKCKPEAPLKRRDASYSSGYYYETVGLGDTCNGITRRCNTDLACLPIQGRNGNFCVKIVNPNVDLCDNEYNQCGHGYTCVIASGQYKGKCVPSASLKRRGGTYGRGYYEYVGLGDICNNISRLCDNGRFCLPIEGRPATYCVNLVTPGGECDNEYNQCTIGHKCVVPSGQYKGKCLPYP
jgi:hypothetical protein